MTDPGHDPSYDTVAALLCRALHTEADMVQPAGDGLGKIQQRTAGSRPWWRPVGAAVLGAAAAITVATGAGIALTRAEEPVSAVVGAPQRGSVAVGSPAAGTTPDRPATPAPSKASTSPAAGPDRDPSEPSRQVGARLTVPVYYIRDDGGAGRLFREFHTVDQPSSEPAVTALLEMFDASRALDPDYRSPWPAGVRVVSYRRVGDLATVQLAGAGRPDELALQQLVHTVTAADEGVARVAVQLDGRPAGAPLVRADTASTLGRIWLTDPQEGETVARKLRIKGEATVEEATVRWQVLRGTEVVRDGFTSASEGAPGRGRWSAEVELPEPGTYILRVYAQTGEDGSTLFEETRTVQVK